MSINFKIFARNNGGQFALESGDWFDTFIHHNDKWEYLVATLKKAIGILPEIHTAIDEVNKSALKGVGKEKQKELYTYLSLLQQNLNNLPAQRIFINYKKANQR